MRDRGGDLVRMTLPHHLLGMNETEKCEAARWALDEIARLRAAEAAAFRRGVEAKKVQIMNLIGNKGERPNPHRDPYPCGWWDARDWHFTAIAALPPPEDKG